MQPLTLLHLAIHQKKQGFEKKKKVLQGEILTSCRVADGMAVINFLKLGVSCFYHKTSLNSLKYINKDMNSVKRELHKEM